MFIYSVEIKEPNVIHKHNFIAADIIKAKQLAQAYFILNNIQKAEIVISDESDKIVDRFNIGWK